MDTPINIGISACLLGQAVRYDGAHKRCDLLLSRAGPEINWVAVCPEVEAGLGVPRPPIELIRRDRVVRLVTVADGRDITVTMQRWLSRRLDQLAAAGLSGFVFKARSPSCGLSLAGEVDRGMFAGALIERLGDIPVIEEAQLVDAAACDAFLRRVRQEAQGGDAEAAPPT